MLRTLTIFFCSYQILDPDLPSMSKVISKPRCRIRICEGTLGGLLT